jgi:hypothetical protein
VSLDADWRSAFVVLRETRAALCVPEAESLIDFARLHFARSVVACEIYNIMDSMPDGVGEAFIRDRVMSALAKFPPNTGTDPRVSDDRPPRLGDEQRGLGMRPLSLDSPPLPGDDRGAPL